MRKWQEKYRENNRFIEYIYLLSFASGLYLFVVASEYETVRASVMYVNYALFSVCLLDLLLYIGFLVWEERDKSKKSLIFFILVKAVLTFVTISIERIRHLLSKFIIGDEGLSHISQIGVINIWLILISCWFFGILLVRHAKLSGFWKNHWVSLVMCLYLLVCFTFALAYYSSDYHSINTYTASFSYSDKLEKDIRSRNVLSHDDYINLSDFQKNDIRSIINGGKDDIEYLNVNIDGQEILLANEKIGEDWAGYYYGGLEKEYNSYAVESVTPIRLTPENVTRRGVNPGFNYAKLLDKDYVIVKVVLMDDPALHTEFDGAVLLVNYDSTRAREMDKSRELNLIFERENFDNYRITASKLEVNIFLNCLSESNTFLDSTISDIGMVSREGSNSLFDYFYYSAVVITTLGFGDMTPISMLVRTLTIIEAFSGLIIMGLFLAKAFEGKNNNKKREQKPLESRSEG